MALTVRDLEICWHVLKGAAETTQSPARRPRVGVLPPHFANRGTIAESLETVEMFVRSVERAGARIFRLTIPLGWESTHQMHRLILSAEAAALYQNAGWLAESPPRFRELVEYGRHVSTDEYQRALHHRLDMRSQIDQMLETCDVLLTPAALGVAPDRATTGDPALNSPWSYTGHPTVSFPVAVDVGLPLAVQLTGRRGGEPALLQAASWCEVVLRQPI
jgi:Asp-tRNA(Asn)/Glu-tRNA(Gln) amidotransferase A subunit family amidase